MHFTLTEKNSVANHFLRELREVSIQKDRMRFRKNVERLGEIMAYEVSKKLDYETVQVTTPLGSSDISVLRDIPVLVTVMRAGLPFFQGFLNFFDGADCGFVGAYRVENKNSLAIKLDYIATTEVTNRTLIVIDPMLATGKSLVDSIQSVLKFGTPKEIHIVSLIAAPEGLKFLTANINVPFHTWTCAVDDKLDSNFYIIPGLGDAGDLSFGVKI
jgi:uracil phosphoribosyltransferase